MQSEDFDKKIIEAADNHHPAYDEKAWAKMEKLLDKHLPQKKDDRRRIIFFLLVFLLLGGGAIFIISKEGKQKQVTGNEQKQIVQPKPVSITEPVTTNNNPAAGQSTVPATRPAGKSESIKQLPVQVSSSTKLSSLTNPNPDYKEMVQDDHKRKVTRVNKSSLVNGYGLQTTGNSPVSPAGNKATSDDMAGIASTNTSDPLKKNSNNGIQQQDPAVRGHLVPAEKKQEEIVIPETRKHEETNRNEESKIIAPVAANKKKQGERKNYFSVTLSAAPDMSAAGSGRPGTIKLLLGGSLGYTFNNRITIRTGFYSGRKVYSASPGQYHPPAGFWAYYPNLQQVDADCKVFEIPLLISYKFGKSARYNWFAGAGLSSYLMKKETYNYFYKNTAGQLESHQYSYLNQNRHYFSVLTLSGGYQQKINNTFFITAEPYFKIPLQGVGYGKVKLNSAGVLLSVGIKPFHPVKHTNKDFH